MSRFYLFFMAAFAAFFSMTASANAEHRLWVKYLDKFVDVDQPEFEYLDTTKSSFIRGAWYDRSKDYMIMNLRDTSYHYCGMPSTVWESFRKAESFGSYYALYIKGSWDCRLHPVPSYN